MCPLRKTCRQIELNGTWARQLNDTVYGIGAYRRSDDNPEKEVAIAIELRKRRKTIGALQLYLGDSLLVKCYIKIVFNMIKSQSLQ
jgi:hypothetical protein